MNSAAPETAPTLTEAPSVDLPGDAVRSLVIYNLFFPFVFLLLLPKYLLRMARRGGYRAKFGERFGMFTPEDSARLESGGWIWVHSISVGETLLALKVAKKIRELDPSAKIVLSVTTSTGFAVAQPSACEWLEIIYNPLDMPFIVQRSFNLIKPSRLIFIEAIWPNLLATAHRAKVPTGFIPRLSPRSERRFKKLALLVGPIFRLIDTFALPDASDVQRWEKIGVPKDRLTVTGNSKFDQGAAGPADPTALRQLLTGAGIPADAPVLLGGSTFPGEERALTEVFRSLRVDFPNLLLILVPRHVERTPAVLTDIAPLEMKVVLRTDLGKDTASAGGPPDIIVVNSTGELRTWYHLASVVFIGKSLLAKGGQNPVEAVMAGKPVVFGPHMENFEPIVREWLAAHAAIQINDEVELRPAVASLLNHPERCAELARVAREIASKHEGATERAARHLLGLK